MFEDTRTYIGLRTDEKTFIRNGDDGHMAIGLIVITLLIVVLIGKACKVSTKGTIGLALLGTILEVFLGMLGVVLLQVLVIPVLIFIIIRVARSIEQTNSDKEERYEKNKMIDDYIKEITDNNHIAGK